jgi:hypothetical protein
VSAFGVGQHVELLVSVQPPQGDTVESGATGVVREADGERFLVEFLSGQQAWLDAAALRART